MKKIILITSTIFALSSCRFNLTREIIVKYEDEKMTLNIILDKRNFSKDIYFGNLKIVNFTNKKMLLPSGTGFCLKNSQRKYRISFDYGYIGNQISSDFLNIIDPKQTFKRKIFVNVDSDFDQENLTISAWREDLFEGDNVITDLSSYLQGCN
jgi:hypothetical protein